MSTPDAKLLVRHVGPLVTMQDAGRFGRLRFGVPASGPMDRFAHAAANVAVGNDPDATAIEVSLGGLELEADSSPVTVAVAGGAADVNHEGERVGSWSALTLCPGQRLKVRAGEWGSWAYVAVAGHLNVSQWLGSTATHSVSGLGGGLVVSGEELLVSEPRLETEREGSFAADAPRRQSGATRVVLGPQQHQFLEHAVPSLCSSTYELTDAFDRMGVRLRGPLLPLGDALSIPSEPIVRGSIQVAGDGVPTVLLADHQTTGGYPKIATVISCDIDRFAQHRSGDVVTFEAVEPAEAISLARAHARRTGEVLRKIGDTRRNVGARLMREDLIGGHSAVAFDVDPHDGDPHDGDPARRSSQADTR